MPPEAAFGGLSERFINKLADDEKSSRPGRNRVDTWVSGGLEGASPDGPVGSGGRDGGVSPVIFDNIIG